MVPYAAAVRSVVRHASGQLVGMSACLVVAAFLLNWQRRPTMEGAKPGCGCQAGGTRKASTRRRAKGRQRSFQVRYLLQILGLTWDWKAVE